jgi:hypothetical protein
MSRFPRFRYLPLLAVRPGRKQSPIEDEIRMHAGPVLYSSIRFSCLMYKDCSQLFRLHFRSGISTKKPFWQMKNGVIHDSVAVSSFSIGSSNQLLGSWVKRSVKTKNQQVKMSTTLGYGASLEVSWRKSTMAPWLLQREGKSIGILAILSEISTIRISIFPIHGLFVYSSQERQIKSRVSVDSFKITC